MASQLAMALIEEVCLAVIGTLPSSWGRPGAWPSMTKLFLGETPYTGE